MSKELNMKYTHETVESILGGIRALLGRVQAVNNAGISYETFTVWMETKPEFSEAIKKTEREAVQVGREKALKAIYTAFDKNWQSAAWYLERSFPEEFGRVMRQNTLKEDNRVDSIRIEIVGGRSNEGEQP